MPMQSSRRSGLERNLYYLPSEVTITGTTAETVVSRVLIKGGTFRSTDTLRTLIMGDKDNSASPGTATFRLRAGPAGAITDTHLAAGLALVLQAANQAFGSWNVWRILSNTQGRRMGNGNAGSGYTSESGQTTAGRAALDTFPDLTQDFYLTLTCQLSVAADVARVTYFEINRKRG